MSFCTKCGQKLPGAIINFAGGAKKYEFEDGEYCEACAKVKVAEARK